MFRECVRRDLEMKEHGRKRMADLLASFMPVSLPNPIPGHTTVVGKSRYGEVAITCHHQSGRVSMEHSHIKGFFIIPTKPVKRPLEFLLPEIRYIILEFLPIQESLALGMLWELESTQGLPGYPLHVPFRGMIEGDMKAPLLTEEAKYEAIIDAHKMRRNYLPDLVEIDLETGEVVVHSDRTPEFWLRFQVPLDMVVKARPVETDVSSSETTMDSSPVRDMEIDSSAMDQEASPSGQKRPLDEADEQVKEKRVKFEAFFDLEAKARDVTTSDGCRLIYFPKVLSSAGVELLRAFLDGLAEDQWATGVSCFGHMVPRLIRWYGPNPYRFAGRNWQPHPYEPVLASFQLQLQDYLRSLTGDETLTFASCLVNKYRHGQDSISKHSDDEREFGVDPAIASISLGTTRTFHVARKHKIGKPDDHFKFALGDGSLLFMGGKTQQLFEHWIPKEPDAVGVRYNCTFRPYVGL